VPSVVAVSNSLFDWQNRRGLVDDLEAQRRAIVQQVAKVDPTEGLDLMWRFMALANSVFARCDDSSGTVSSIFHAACHDLGEMAQTAKVTPEELAQRTFNTLIDNDYGQYDELIAVLTPALGPTGLDQLKGRFVELSKVPPERPRQKDRKVIGCRSEISPSNLGRSIRLRTECVAARAGNMSVAAEKVGYDRAAKLAAIPAGESPANRGVQSLL
jgi:hypothetical protein